jgi:hypothetical protein
MSKESDKDLLNRTYIAAPCDVDWDSMTGDDRIRFCGQCKLNVYNVASMSAKETARLIRETEGRLCMKLYRRRDGTILTDNCPVGLKRIRDRLKLCVAAALALLVTAGLLSAAQAQGMVGAPVDCIPRARGMFVACDFSWLLLARMPNIARPY